MVICPGLNIIPRSEWSTNDTVPRLVNVTLTVNSMMYTHTQSERCNNPVWCAHIVLEIYNYHMGKPNRFRDIGYNFLIGGDGSVFEGRGWHFPGEFNPDPDNRGFGTAFIGQYTVREDFAYAVAKSAHGLLKCALRNGYLNPAKYTVTVWRIDPAIRDYILNPETLKPPTLTTDPSHGEDSVTEVTFSNGVLVGMAFSVLAFILLTALITLFLRKLRNKPKASEDYRAAIQKLVPQHLLERYERPRSSVDLRDICLGVGQYGQVYKGLLLSEKARTPLAATMSGCRPVAVKMLRADSSDNRGTTQFLAEMGILMKVARHVNIVNLEGVILQGRLMMVMEYCECGSLENYLRKLKRQMSLSDPNSVPEEPDQSSTDGTLDVTELVKISYQISRGMQFLSSENVIHRDLAARNILLTTDKTAKIADFGMAREQLGHILEREKVPLPICWMAPESVLPGGGVFTTYTDVWSFGIVLWEIFSLGEIPYAAEFPNGIFYDQLCSFHQEDRRLQTPDLCPEMVEKMNECPELHSIPRLDWSAQNASGGLEYLQLPVNFMVYTHTYFYACNSTVSCLPLVRQIQDMHMGPTFNFSDIGYHFLIGGDGTVFEAREWRIKASFNRKYNRRGFGTAFMGKFSVEGDDFHELPYEAALSAHKLFQCALRNNYLDPTNHSVVTSRINPMIRNYILDPELLRPSTPSTTVRPTTTGIHKSTISSLTTSTVETTTATQGLPLLTDGAVAGIAVGTGILAFLIFFLFWYFCRRRRNDKSAEDYRAAIRRIVPENIVALYEKPRWSIDLQDICVRIGQHVQVHQGVLIDQNSLNVSCSVMASSRPVAIKTLREGCNEQQTSRFLEEMSILMKIGRHANIVNLDGVVLQGKLMMAIERCELGSLENYLRKLNTDQDEQCIVTTELINLAHQISRGMEFLSCKGVIHADLAARNILLDAEKTAKIADFGMPRDQHEYVPDKEVPLSVCWMAPELILPEVRIFTTQSDVWSFSVVLWEIFTLGGIPYASEFPNGVLYVQLCSFLVQGQRLEIPQRSPDAVGRLMAECWNFPPEERPGFPSLRQSLEVLLPIPERGQYITCGHQNEELGVRLMDPIGNNSAVQTDQP